MSFKSKDFYVEIKGDNALFTSPETKGGGEKFTYIVPTKQALQGIVDNLYWKPVLINVVEEVKIINEIKTIVKGVRALISDGSQDLNFYSYLSEVRYYVKFHFIWNDNREDLKQDRNIRKHEEIMERSIKKGGRMDIFLGTRECVGYVNPITEAEYNKDSEDHKNRNLNLDLGIMFHSFKYPNNEKENLIAYYANTKIIDGKITFKKQEECEIKNEIKSYTFKRPENYKNVDTEYEEYFN